MTVDEKPPLRPAETDGFVPSAFVLFRVVTGLATSAFKRHCAWIGAEVARGRNAVSVYQVVVD